MPRHLTLTLLLLVAWAVAPAMARPGTSPTPARHGGKPVISGAFFGFPGHDGWSRERWSQELDWMQALGLDTLILTTAVKEQTAFYPTRVPGLKAVPGDPLEIILSEADRRGMRIHLMMYDTVAYWKQSSAAFYDGLAATMKPIATDLYQRYGKHASLVGFYLIPEFWFPATPELRDVWIQHFARPISDYIVGLDPRLKVSCAPFVGSEMAYNAAVYQDFWERILRGAPNLSLLMLQDGIGANETNDLYSKGRTYAFVSEIFQRTHAATRATTRTLWADLEAFEAVGAGYPPHHSRIEQQLRTCAPEVAKIIGFEWVYWSPVQSVASAEFCENYKRYLKDETCLENAARDAEYQLEPPPDARWPDAERKLTDGGQDGQAATDFVGWDQQPQAAITIDLQRRTPGICGFAISVMNGGGHAGVLPEAITVSVGEHPETLREVAILREPLARDSGQVTYQLLNLKPMQGRYVRFALKTRDRARLLVSEAAVYSTMPHWASRQAKYSVSLAPAAQFPDEGGELTDGLFSRRWYAQTGWKNLDRPLTVTLDLGHAQAIAGAEAWLLRNDKADVSLPQAMQFASSVDGTIFSPLGSVSVVNPRDAQANCFACVKAAQARYVRVTLPARTGWTMLNEIRVWSADESPVEPTPKS